MTENDATSLNTRNNYQAKFNLFDQRQVPTIVTAFFDIGRANFGEGFKRDNSKYLGYFSFWARIRNHMIIYTEPKMYEQVMNIRKSFGLEKETTIVTIDDVRDLDREIYESMEKALSNPKTVNFRVNPNNPECNNALYNFVVYAKVIFIQDVMRRGVCNDWIAWVDFGYNHGGEYYLEPDDFDFLWTVDLDVTKAHYFCFDLKDDIPIWEIVRSMPNCIAGGLFMVPSSLAENIRMLYREAAVALSACGFSDDDQTLALMAYRSNPDLFAMHYLPSGGWFQPLEILTDKYKKFSTHTLFTPPPHIITKDIAKKKWRNKEYFLSVMGFVKCFFQKVCGK